MTLAGIGGFTLQGSGTAIVTTPNSYRPGSLKVVTVGATAKSIRVDRQGRLRVVVSLGTAGSTVQIAIR